MLVLGVGCGGRFGSRARLWVGHVRARVLMRLSTIICFLYMQNGYTALLLSASYGHPDILELLLQHGADINIKNKVSRSEG